MRHLARDRVGRFRAVLVSADRLRPQAKRTLRRAAAAGVVRDVRMLEVADRVVLDREVARVHVHHARQRVEVRDQRALRVVNDRAIAPERQAVDLRERPALRHVAAGEIELLAADEIDRLARAQRLLRQHRRMRADEPHAHIRVLRLERFRELRVAAQCRRARVQDHQLVVVRDPQDVVAREIVRRRIDQPRAFDQRGRLREPRRIPKRTNLALRLVARPGAAVEAPPRRRIDEKRFQKRAHARCITHWLCECIDDFTSLPAEIPELPNRAHFQLALAG